MNWARYVALFPLAFVGLAVLILLIPVLIAGLPLVILFGVIALAERMRR